MRCYDVSWGCSPVRHVHVRANNAVDAAFSVAERFGWPRSSYSVDASTCGDLFCELFVDRYRGSRYLGQSFVVATLLEES